MAESSTILRGAVTTNKANKAVYIVGEVVIVALIAASIISSISSAGRTTARWAKSSPSRRP